MYINNRRNVINTIVRAFILSVTLMSIAIIMISESERTYGAAAGSSFSTAVPITAGRVTNGTLSGGNYYYKFTKTSGSCKVIISSASSKTATLYDENYSVIGSCSCYSSASAGTTRKFYLLGGTYYIKVSGTSGDFAVSYTWYNTNETVPETQSKKHDTISNAADLSIGKLSTAQLGDNDYADAFKFSVPRDGTLIVSKFYVSGNESSVKGQLYNSKGSPEGKSFYTSYGSDNIYSLDISAGTHYVIFSGGEGEYFYNLTFRGKSDGEIGDDKSITIDMSNGEATYTGSDAKSIYAYMFWLSGDLFNDNGGDIIDSDGAEDESYGYYRVYYTYDLDKNGSWDISAYYDVDYYKDASTNDFVDVVNEAIFKRLSTCSIGSKVSYNYSFDQKNKDYIYKRYDLDYLFTDVEFEFRTPDVVAAVTDADSVLAQVKKLKADDYTYDSFKKVTDAKAALEKVLAKDDVNSNEITAATKALTDAIDALKAKSIVKTKKNNPMVAKAKTKIINVKAAKLKTKAIKIKKSKAFKVTKAKGTISYKLTKKAKKAKSKITVTKKGVIKLAKGLKKGKYVIKVRVRAAGTNEYKAKSKTIKITIKVK